MYPIVIQFADNNLYRLIKNEADLLKIGDRQIYVVATDLIEKRENHWPKQGECRPYHNPREFLTNVARRKAERLARQS